MVDRLYKIKKWPRKLIFKGTNTRKKIIVRSLFWLKLSNRDEDNLFHKVRKNANGKDLLESCINDEIPECKCVNDPVKDDIALHEKI